MNSRIHLLSGVIVLVTFLLGAAAGAGVHAWLTPQHHGPGFGMRGPGGPGGPGRGPPPYLRELELTEEQRKAADAIFEKHRAAIEVVMKDSFPKVRELNDAMEADLRKLLTEEQMKKLDELKARRPPFPGGFGGPLPPPPPPPP